MDQQQISPEQKKHFDLALKQAIEFLTEGDAPKVIVQKAETQGPEKAALDTMMPLLQNIYAAAREAGANVGTEVMFAVGIHVLKVIAELLVMAQILEEGQVEEFAKNVSQQAVQMHNAQFGGA
jgi:hypothetical protein